MSSYPIFISSSDAYSDLWPIFFDFFAKNWPEYDGVIYLNTEEKVFQYEGLNIICTKVGTNSFGRTFRKGLEKVESPCLMLIMIDYIFMGKVDAQALEKYFQFFLKEDLDSLCLIDNPYTTSESMNYLDVHRVIPPSQDMFSFQIAFWKRNALFEMVLPHENPWLSEWYGTIRANMIELRLAYAVKERPIPYLAEGALHKGQWVEPMIAYLQEVNYHVDFSKRGLFEKRPNTIAARAKGRIKTFFPRCLSNIDLARRRMGIR